MIGFLLDIVFFLCVTFFSQHDSDPISGDYKYFFVTFSRRQQHYHSQRSARETRMSPPGGNQWSGSDRPVSNYFEYESLHIAGHTVALSGPPYKYVVIFT